MKHRWPFFFLGLFLLITTACISPNPPEVDSITPSAPPETPAKTGARMGTFFSIDEVGLGPDGFVALANFTDLSANLAGLYLCQSTQCFQLPDQMVAPGKTVRIAVGDGSGLEDVVAAHATFGELRPADGEIALYASPDIQDPGQMLVYLQWGSTPHASTATAIQAGLWIKDGYAPASQSATRLFKVKETGLWLFEER
jgi:hypothetical protein